MLNATNLGHRYAAGDWLFRGLDLSVEPGEVVAVLGPNARGKTTLLTCLAGVLKAREGKVTHEGQIGYVPQSSASDHPFTAHQMVLMGRTRAMRAWSSPSAEDHAAAKEALARVGLAERAEDAFSSLSGGQRQLVLIARALVCDPTMIILDEPTAALDLRNQRRVLSVIAQLSASGIGVLFTTHDPTHALHVSQRTLLMDTELSVGPTAELLTAARLSELYRTPVCTTAVEFRSGTRTVVVPDLLEDPA